PSGVSGLGGSLLAYKAESATLTASDGTLSTATAGGAGVALTVSAAAASAYRLSAATATPTAGTADVLTVTLVDQYQNTETAFSGPKTLTFAGLGTAPGGTAPTVTNNTGSPINEGTATTITFTAGVSSGGGTLLAYK